jgi:predicted amidohydrolase
MEDLFEMDFQNCIREEKGRAARLGFAWIFTFIACVPLIGSPSLAQQNQPAGVEHEFEVLERAYSAESDGLTIGLANMRNLVSPGEKDLMQGKSIQANQRKMLSAIDTLKPYGVNMIVFPEFSLTGYFWDDPMWDQGTSPFNPAGDAECWEYMKKGSLDQNKAWLKEAKSKLDANLKYIIFTSIRKNPKNGIAPAGPANKFLNSTFIVDKDFDCEDFSQNEISRIYDKTFLPGIEKVYLESGQSDHLILETVWGRLGFGICYDLCFSQLFQEYAMIHQVDGVILTASWRGTAQREYPNLNVRTDQYYGFLWDLMASARAATNQIWMITSNAVGTQRRGNYRFWGGSGVWAPSGMSLVEASRVKEELLVIRGLDIQGEIRKEQDDFWYFKDFTEIYRSMADQRSFTRVR